VGPLTLPIIVQRWCRRHRRYVAAAVPDLSPMQSCENFYSTIKKQANSEREKQASTTSAAHNTHKSQGPIDIELLEAPASRGSPAVVRADPDARADW